MTIKKWQSKSDNQKATIKKWQSKSDNQKVCDIEIVILTLSLWQKHFDNVILWQLLHGDNVEIWHFDKITLGLCDIITM